MSMIHGYEAACVCLGRLLVSDELLVITSNLCHTSLQSKAASTSACVQINLSLTTGGARQNIVMEQHLSHCTPELVMKFYLLLKQADFPLKT